MAAESAEAPPSQVEDLVANANSLFLTVYPKGPSAALSNVASGFTVSLAMIPEAVAFAFVAGVSPLVGLWSAVVMGFFAAAFGGRGGIVTGASGACAVVMAKLVATHGEAYLSAGVLLAGLLQLAAGWLRLGKFIRLVPHPVMLGFVNGLAVVMFRAQLTHFRSAATGAWLTGLPALSMGVLTALTMFVVKAAPRVTTALPPALIATGVTTVVAKLLLLCGLPARTLVDIAGAETFAGGLKILPRLGLPSLPGFGATPLRALGVIAPYALTMAAVGLIESLLTLQLVDGLVDDGSRGSTSKECVGQGLGNLFSGLTSGMGGCALIGQSLINVESGGTSRLSGVAMSLFLGTGILAAAPLLGQVPIAALVGIMLLVCHSTFSWSSLRLLKKIPRTDVFVICLVSAITVVADLAKAVFAGTIVSALSYAWKMSTAIGVRATSTKADELLGWRTYKVEGPLFFGSTANFDGGFTPKQDPNDVVLDFANSRVMDHSALEAINALASKYGALQKRVHLRGLSSDCSALLAKLNGGANPPYELIEPNPATDPVYEVAVSGMYDQTKFPGGAGGAPAGDEMVPDLPTA